MLTRCCPLPSHFFADLLDLGGVSETKELIHSELFELQIWPHFEDTVMGNSEKTVKGTLSPISR